MPHSETSDESRATSPPHPAPSAKRAGEFRILACVWMTAYVVHLTDDWAHPGAAVFFMGAALFVVATRVGVWSFFLFLWLATGNVLLFHFPDVTNHENIYVLTNGFLTVGLLDRLWRSRGRVAAEDVVEIMKPTLRVGLSVVYIFAGFHKLNWDFFDPVAGCGPRFFERVAAKVGLAGVAWPGFVTLSASVYVLFWEVGGGLMLWFRRLQLPVLALAWFMHALLAQLVYTDFSSVAFALILSFVPASQLALITRSPLRLGRLEVPRASVYVLVIVAAASYTGLYTFVNGFHWSLYRWHGLGLNVAFLVLIWPILVNRLRPGRIRWEGVPVWGRPFPWWRVVFVGCLLAHGLSPYLGLRTTGSFTMFSNLRTEGEASNHLLLSGNPLKRWGYQEDVVEILDIDPRHEEGLRQSLKGFSLPVVEFKKRIYDWRTDGLDGLYAVYRYEGRLYETSDLAHDNPWNIERRDLPMMLMDFRVIETGPGPTGCRW